MEEHENLYEKIKEILGDDPGNLKVLEHEIDMDLQLKFHRCSLQAREQRSEAWALEHMSCLTDADYALDQKKELLARLASIGRVECYRAIEAYMDQAPEDLVSWAYLALNENRLLLESKILNENQVFISTGLGGKDEKLRYFAVLMTQTKLNLTSTQKMVIKNEFDYILKKFDAEVEKVDFSDYLATITLLLPMHHSLKTVFKAAIDECNRYGHFLNDNFIVTNVKVLSFSEIKQFLERGSGD